MACVVAALSLTAAACADEVPTSGDNEISVKDTDYKANQDPKTRAIRPGTSLADQLGGNAYDWNLIRFPTRLGISAEELPPRAMNRDTSGLTSVSLYPSVAAAPFQGDRAMDRSTDCLTTTSSLTMGMNHDSDLAGTTLTNGRNHATAGIAGEHFILIVEHANNGTTDTATVSLEDGTFVCQIVQTAQEVISNTCAQIQAKKPPPVGGGVGSC
jgi:hypothetical protein